MAMGDTGKRHPEIDDAVNLKICDLCGALNIASDSECVVCRWHGHFERRPEVVRIALEFHMQRQQNSSDLRPSPFDGANPEDRTYGFWARFADFWSGLWRRVRPRRYYHA
jgi:hypothetical protein